MPAGFRQSIFNLRSPQSSGLAGFNSNAIRENSLRRLAEQELQRVRGLQEIENIRANQETDTGLIEFGLGALQKPLDFVKNVGEGFGELLSGDFDNALRAGGRALGSAIPFSELALRTVGLDDEVAAALRSTDTIGTGTPINDVFGSQIRSRDVASELGEVFGQRATNDDPNGDLLSEFNLLQHPGQDLLTAGFTGLEFLLDPVNFILPGAGAAAKGVKAGSRLAGAADSVASRKALSELGILDQLTSAGVNAGRLTDDNSALITRALGGGDEAKAFAGQFSDAFRQNQGALLEGGQDSIDAFRRFGGDRINKLLDDALEAQAKTGATSIIPRETLKARSQAKQITLFGGPYGKVLQAGLGGADSKIVQRVNDSVFGFMTAANAVAGAGSSLFKPAEKVFQKMRTKKAAITAKDARDFERGASSLANALPESVTKGRLERALGGTLRKVLQDAETPEVANIVLQADSVRSSVSYMWSVQGDAILDDLVRKTEGAKDLFPKKAREVEEFRTGVIREVESKAGEFPEEIRGLLGDSELDDLISGAANDVDELNKLNLNLQNLSGVYIDELVDSRGYYERYVKEEYRDLVDTTVFKRVMRKARSNGVGIDKGAAAKGRNADVNFEEVDRYLVEQLNMAGIDIKKGTKLFEDDPLKNALHARSEAQERVVQSRLMSKLFDEFGQGFDPVDVRSIAQDVTAAHPNFSALTPEAKIKAVRKFLPEEAADDLVDGLEAISKQGYVAIPRDAESLIQLGLQKVDKRVFDDFANVFSLAGRETPKGLTKKLDGFIGYFRSALLASPIGAARDFLANVVQGATLGGQIRDPALSINASRLYALARTELGDTNGVLKVLSKGAKDVTLDAIEGQSSLLSEMRQLISSGFFSEATTKAAERGAQGQLKAGLRKGAGAIKKGASKVADVSISARSGGENVMKAAQYAHYRKLGYSVDDAVSATQRIFFNFNDVTKFEKETLRKTFLFYTWAKKAIPLSLRTTLEDPIRFKMLKLLAGAGANGNDPDLPEWARRIPGYRIGTDEAGNPTLVSLGNTILSPTMDILEGNVIKNLARSLTPTLKIPLETAMEEDLFTGKRINLWGNAQEEENRGQTANRAPSWLRFVPGSKEIFGFAPKVDKDGTVIGFTMNSDHRFLFENVFGLGSLSAAIDTLGGLDPRKSGLQQVGTAAGVRSISLPQLKDDQRLLSLINKTKDQVAEKLNDIPGKPLKFSYGRVVPNERSAEGFKLKQSLDKVKEFTSNQARAAGMSRDERAERLDEIELVFMRRYMPSYGATKMMLERLDAASDYLRDPKKYEEKRSKRLKKVLDEDSQRAVKRALGLR